MDTKKTHNHNLIIFRMQISKIKSDNSKNFVKDVSAPFKNSTIMKEICANMYQKHQETSLDKRCWAHLMSEWFKTRTVCTIRTAIK
jgi:hypothetical protein